MSERRALCRHSFFLLYLKSVEYLEVQKPQKPRETTPRKQASRLCGRFNCKRYTSFSKLGLEAKE